MSNSSLEQLLSGKWHSSVNGEVIRSPIDHIVIGDVRGNVHHYIEQLGWNVKTILVVCDENTDKILGEDISSRIKAKKHILPHPVKPTLAAIRQVVGVIKVQKIEAVIAVGSGTLNDICKYASFLAGKPYVVFPTAPSMNGYASISASVIDKGYRTSKRAHLPTGIFVDLEVLMQAPRALIHSGVGDSLCCFTAQADWLMSHLLLDTSYNKVPFDLLKRDVNTLLEQSGSLLKNDEKAMYSLVSLLILSGIGMTLANGSYPASQGEHMIAHTMEMRNAQLSLDIQPEIYHGQYIAVTTLTMANIQEFVLERGVEQSALSFADLPENEINQYFGGYVAESCIQASRLKYHQWPKIAEAIQQKDKWQEVVKHVSPLLLSSRHLLEIFTEIGAPTSPAELGWSLENYGEAVKMAKYSRERFTFLDLVVLQ